MIVPVSETHQSAGANSACRFGNLSLSQGTAAQSNVSV